MKKIVALAVASLVSTMALANEPGKTDTGLDYNKIEIDYASAKIGSKKNYTGYYVSGSFLVSESIMCWATTPVLINQPNQPT
jgi:hypothetical protein